MSRIWQALRAAERERARAREDQNWVSDPSAIDDPDRALPREADRPTRPSSVDRRKALRHAYDVAVLVYGSGLDKQPFHEQSETIDANENGCLIVLATEVSRGQRLVLTNMRNSAEQECRVVYIAASEHGNRRVGVEFIKPSPDFWRLS